MFDWNLNIIFEEIVPAHLLGVALWKGSPEISDTSWKIVSVRGVIYLATNAHLTLFSSPSLNSFSSSSPTTSSGLMKALPLLRGSLATRTKVASVHLIAFVEKVVVKKVPTRRWGIDSVTYPSWKSPTSSTLHPPAAPAADSTLPNCFPPRWCDPTSGCHSRPWKNTQFIILDMRREHLKDAVKSIWSTRAVTMEKGDAWPSPW